MCAPGISGISADLDITSSAVSTLAITLYVLGLAIGPMFMSPVSEVYGRVPVYHAANIIFVAMIIGSALSWNLAQFLVFRFISGCAGGTPMALGGGTIADITTIEQRAVAMAFFSMGPLAGPVCVIMNSFFDFQITSPISFRSLVLLSEASSLQAKAGAGLSGC